MKLTVISLALLLFIVGCVSPPSSESALSPAPNVSLAEPNRPGDAMTFCLDGSSALNQSCFESALATCTKSIGLFWKTSDGYPLLFETQGVDATTQRCRVRISAADDESASFGESSACELSLGEGSSSYLLSDISSATCGGSLISTLVQTK